MRRPSTLTAVLFALAGVASATPRLTVEAGTGMLAGQLPGLRVSGTPPGETIRVHAFRIQEGTLFHAWATFRAGSQAAIELERQAPREGTYTGIEPRGLLWSGYPEASGKTPSAPTAVPARTVNFQLEYKGEIVDSRSLAIRPWNDDIEFTKVQTPTVSGYFAAPKGAAKLPVLITLHGSEGGTFEAARQSAGLWASHGFATLSLIYFSWSYANIPQVPQAFDGIPVERMNAAREWLAARPEADVDRLALHGVSKGSEFAALAAVQYPWVRAVAACVPTSLVWGAFGAPLDDGKPHSGFSFKGQPLPNLPYGDYQPVETGKITLAGRHRLDRAAATPASVKAASIPIEGSAASFLLIGSGQDAIWPSLEMAGELAARLPPPQVTLLTFSEAGHFICGTGDSLVRSAKGKPSSGGGTDAGNGHAASLAWDRTLAFLTAFQKP